MKPIYQAIGLSLVSLALLVPAAWGQAGDKVDQAAPAGQAKPDKKTTSKKSDKAKTTAAGTDSSRSAKPAGTQPKGSDLHVVPAGKPGPGGAAVVPGNNTQGAP